MIGRILLVSAPNSEDIEQLRKRLKVVEQEFEVVKQELTESAAMLQVVQQELLDSATIVPDRFLENLQHSTVQILDASDEPVGVGFFVSSNIIVTAFHNIEDQSNIRALITSGDGQKNTHTLTFTAAALEMLEKCKNLDIGILRVETPHRYHLSIYAYDENNSRRKDFALASYSIGLVQQVPPERLGDKFGVMPVVIYKVTTNHVIYLSNCFSGDSGGAVICSTKGEVFALHLETVNQASEELDKEKFTLEDVAESVNSCVRGFSQGFLGLRLDSADINSLIFA